MSSFRRPLTVQMPDAYELVKGQKVVTAPGATITIMASVQPPRVYDFDQVKADLGGARIDRVIMVTTSPEPRLPVADPEADPEAGTEPCYFVWQGRRYRCAAEREGLAGVIPHMQYYGVQELEE